ncbi:hypothetical protein EJ08DRAFT_432106 [Tothia fuscella]|uniref:Uncharacterized protein n=1 Tax=Tothia fuscella TaxID=1048955 RepID=A0A9P4U3D7_9PEZI|nr:hypothetical protein EJ08DRAFT_432106 [Tothia fuscella]
MTEDTPVRPHGVSRYLSKDRWRFGSQKSPSLPPDPQQTTAPPAAAKNFTLNDDVQDFLKPSTSKSRPISPKTPKIDIAAAQKWASSTDNNTLATPSSLVKKDYPRRKLNLSVGWKKAPPEVIGSGGDESESPVIEISRRRRERGGQPEFLGGQGQAPISRDAIAGSNPPPGGQQTPKAADFASSYRDLVASNPHTQPQPQEDIDDFVPKPLQRQPTSFHAEEKEVQIRPSFDSERSLEPPSRGPSMRDGKKQPWQLPEFDSVVNHSPIDVTKRMEEMHFDRNQRKDSNLSVYEEKIHRMRAEEGKALHEASHHSMPEDDVSKRFSSSTTSSFKAQSPVANPPANFHDVVQGSMSHQTSTSSRGPGKPFDRQSPEIHNHSQSPSRVPMPPPERERWLEHAPDTPENGFISSQTQRQNQGFPQPRPPIATALSFQPLQGRENFDSQQPTPSPSYPSQYQHESHNHPPQPLSMRKPVSASLAPANRISQESPQKSPRPFPLPIYIPENIANSGRSSIDQPAYSAYRGQELQSAASSNPKTPYTASSQRYNSQRESNSMPLENPVPATDDFAERCSHMGGIFRLQAEFERPITEFTPMHWIRAGTWWFLRGRVGIEALVRSLPRRADGRPDSRNGEQRLAQPHVDLAKTHWILNDIIASHPGLRPSHATRFGQRAVEAHNAGDALAAEVLDAAEMLLVNLEAVLGSMRRNNVMPPTSALIQGQDQSIWIRYPTLAPNILPILSGNMSRSLTDAGNVQKFNPLSVMAVQDTKTDFSYNRIFVSASLGTEDENIERISLSCLVSIMRERNDWHPKLTICTQKELLTICIQGERKRGPSWSDVKWNERTSSIHVQIQHGYNLDLQLSENDFRQLYSMYNQAFRVQSSLLPHSNERVIHEVHLLDFQYTDSRKPPSFPPERVKRCRIRIFERCEVRNEGRGQRKLYKGFRILAVTSPKNRILGSASHELGVRYPIAMETTSDPNNQGAPAIRLQIQEDRRQCILFMVLSSPEDLNTLSKALRSMEVHPNESQFASLRLKGITLEPIDASEAYSPASRNPLAHLRWQHLSVVNKDPENPDHDVGQTIMSEHLRIIATAAEGSWTDRMNLGPGELRLRLPTDGSSSLSILRPQQDDLSISIDTAAIDPNLANSLSDVQRTAFSQPTKRTYSFHTATDLHCFQTAITGFITKYDGLVSTFTIARRRPVTALSKHKKLEGTATRIQVVAHKHMRVVQLLAFFDDLSATEALNFHLKPVDVFERHDSKHGKGRYGVRLVDAKFTLPKLDREEKRQSNGLDGVNAQSSGLKKVERAFVSLDMPEIPAENDDITVGFEDEAERERFLAALPAAATPARGLTLKRRI